MSIETLHPSSDELVAFLAGRLDHTSDSTIDQHVSACSSCRSTLDGICEGTDGFSERLAEIASNSTLVIQFDRTRTPTTPRDANLPLKQDACRTNTAGIEQFPPIVNDSQAHANADTKIDGDRYRITRELGRGGMGIVYQGRDDLLERDLVLKVLNPGDQSNPAALQRFISEARICGSLQHPGVVPIHDIGRLADQRPFFTMKQVEGQTLREWLESREAHDSDNATLLGIFSQVCQTVAFAHSQGIIHRDLKPENIMVGAFGEVQVLDWGLAKRLGDASQSSTDTTDSTDLNSHVVGVDAARATIAGSVMGTPAYMSPEQAEGKNDATNKRTDVFALGAILCEILTRQAPFTTNSMASNLTPEERIQTRRQQLAATHERLERLGDDQVLIKYCKSCLAPNPEDRPSDASCVATAMLDHRQSIDRRVRQAEIERSQTLATLQEQRKRHRLVLWSAFAVSLLSLALIGGLAYHTIQSVQSESKLVQETHKGHELSVALSRQENDYARAMMLADNYRGDDLKRMLRAYDDAAADCHPLRAADRWLATHATQASTEREFVHRLFEAHAWQATRTTGEIRQQCLTEADRAYRSAFAVFANWRAPADISVASATKMLKFYDRSTQLAAVNAIDDWIRLLQRMTAENGLTPPAAQIPWMRRVANELDPNETGCEIRRLASEGNAEGLLRFASGSEFLNLSPAQIHALVFALEKVDHHETSQELLTTARLHYGDAFWLAGFVLRTDRDDVDSTIMWKPHEAADILQVFMAGRENTRARRYELALQQFDWVLRDLDRASRELSDAQLTHVLFRWSELAHVFPTAREHLMNVRQRCEAQLFSDAANTGSFRIVAALDSVLMSSDETAELFARVDAQNPELAAKLFPFAQTSLGQHGQSRLLSKYGAGLPRTIPRLIDAGDPTATLEVQKRFELTATLVACLAREGRKLEALEIATDARVIYADEQSLRTLDQAIEGILPGSTTAGR